MSIVIISFSLTGNNEALAASVAKKLEAEHIIIREEKTRTMFTTILDMIFNRIPRVKFNMECLKNYNRIILFGPIWMGKVATPLRGYLDYIKSNGLPYSFISISGGADGSNPKLLDELIERTNISPRCVLDLHISDLIVAEAAPTRKDTSAYRLTQDDVAKLTIKVLNNIKD